MTREAYPPARPWYNFILREIAQRSWTKTELSDRSGVARTTIDNWRTNRRSPTDGTVNDVADVLGIDRAAAHDLAGVIDPGAGPEIESAAMADLHKQFRDNPEGLLKAIRAMRDLLRIQAEQRERAAAPAREPAAAPASAESGSSRKAG